MSGNIRFSTNLITFYAPQIWGLPADLPYPDWTAAFESDPRRYFERMFDLAREGGVEGVEFAPYPGGWQAALAAFGSARAVADAVAERGLRVSSGYSPGRTLIGNAMNDPSQESVADDHIRGHAEFLAEIGATTIVMGNIPRSRFGNNPPDETATAADFDAPVRREVHERYAEQMNRLGAIAQQFGVTIAIHTDAHSVCSRPQDIATVLSLTDPQSVGLCPDAGHITLDGGDAVAVLRDHLDRIPTMHWKDCIGPLGGHTLRGEQKVRHHRMLQNFRILGSGIVDWETWMHVLRDNRWRGWATEEIDHSPDPVAELRTGIDYFHDHLEGIYS